VSWFNDFIGQLSLETKPLPKVNLTPNYINRLTVA